MNPVNTEISKATQEKLLASLVTPDQGYYEEIIRFLRRANNISKALSLTFSETDKVTAMPSPTELSAIFGTLSSDIEMAMILTQGLYDHLKESPAKHERENAHD
ncbi:MAG: hypothetical protein ACOYMG_06845 [Candidatus Methylumidiphilus sp.]